MNVPEPLHIVENEPSQGYDHEDNKGNADEEN